MDLGAMIGGAAQAAASAWAVKQQIKWERERAQNAHQWEVKDLQAAGLNPILSAGGQGAATGGIDAPDMSGLGEMGKSLTAVNAQKQQKFENELKQKQVNNETKVANSTVLSNNANAARTLALTPEEVKTHQWGRQSRLGKELGIEEHYTNMKNKLIQGIQNSAEKVAQWQVEHEPKTPEPKPKKHKIHKIHQLTPQDKERSWQY